MTPVFRASIVSRLPSILLGLGLAACGGGGGSDTGSSVPTVSLRVTVSGTGAGTVTSSPAGINCGTDCAEEHVRGTVVTLTASPNAGSTFAGFTGSADCADGTVTLSASVTCNAQFSSTISNPPSTFTLTILKSGNASGNDFTVTSTPAGINCGSDCAEAYSSGTRVTLNLAASNGVIFRSFGDGDCSDGTVTMTANVSCEVRYDQMPNSGNVTLSVTKSGSGSGRVSSSPLGLDCGSDCSEAYARGTTVLLQPSAATGSVFAGFRGDPDCVDGEVTLTADLNCNALFNPSSSDRSFALSISMSGMGLGKVTSDPAAINCGSACVRLFEEGTRVTLSATPEPGYVFRGFSGATDCTDGSVTMTSDMPCDAIFDLETPPPPTTSVWLDTTPGTREIFASRSIDGAASYSTPVNVSLNVGTMASTPQVATSNPVVIVVWSDLMGGVNSEIFMARSTDGGLSFAAPVNLSNSVGASTNPQIAVVGSSVGIVWTETSSRKEIVSVYSFDTGSSFTGQFVESSGTTSTDSAFPQIVISGTTSLVVWRESTATAQIIARRSTNLSSVSPTRGPLLALSTVASLSPQMAVSGNNLVIAYAGQSAGASTDIFSVQSGDFGSSFGAPINVSNDVAASNEPRIAISGQTALLVYQVATNDPPGKTEIFLARSSNAGLSFTRGKSMDSGFIQAARPDVAIAGSNAIVTWDDGSSGTSDRQIAVSHSTDGGANFNFARALSPSNTSAGNAQATFLGAVTAVINWNTLNSGAEDIFAARSLRRGDFGSGNVNLSRNSGSSTKPGLASDQKASARPCTASTDGSCSD